MSDVVDFLSAERMVWSCECGNQSYYIYDNGSVECVFCESIQDEEVTMCVPRKLTRMMTDEERERFNKIDKEVSLDE